MRTQLPTRILRLVLSLIAGAVASPLVAQDSAAKAQFDTALATQVTRLADRYVAAVFEYYPEQTVFAGLANAPQDRLADNSLAALGRWQAIVDSLAGALAPIAPTRIAGSQAWITYGYLRTALDADRATRICRTELWPVNQLFGWQTALPQLATLQPTGTPETRAAALARWRGLSAYVETEIANLREGLRLGYTASNSVVRAVLAQLDGLLALPNDSLPFLEPIRHDSMPEFAAAFRPLAVDSVRAAAQRYRDFLQREYLAKARQSVALTANPDGTACYRALLQQVTSVDRDPEALWREATAEVARDSAGLLAVARKVYRPRRGVRVDLRWLRHQFERDSGNLIPGADSVRAFTLAAMNRARAALPRWFATVPTTDVVLVPFPAYQQPNAPGGQYLPGTEDGSRPGTYLYRTYPPVRRVSLAGVIFHETWPGHHLQIATIGEQRGRHPITKLVSVPGFTEGWATYAEGLADEMGLYQDPRDRFNPFLLVTPLMVADLGMQIRGWTVAQARRYVQLHEPNLPRERVAVAVDLLAAIPGYVASYTVGELEIWRLRRQAEKALGKQFDIRAFHQAVLEDGAIPLPLLARRIDAWINARAAGHGRAPKVGVH